MKQTHGIRGAIAFVAAAGLTACSAGSLSEDFVAPSLAASYLNLQRTDGSVQIPGGAAFVVAPNVAVTNAHNANLVPSSDVLARSEYHDLLFFWTERTTPVETAAPRVGMHVVAYGNGGGDERREAAGVIETFPATTEDCAICPPDVVFGYRAPAGPGFSGGPVVDAQTGAAVGITFRYVDAPLETGLPRLMLAYDVALVRSEMGRLLGQ